MFEQTFKNIDDVLWKEAGCATELDYTEQTSWLLFLKYLGDLEQRRAMNATLAGKSFDFIIDTPYQWSTWAAPRKRDGSLDRDRALTGDDLLDFVNRELFPYLHGIEASNLVHSNTLTENLADLQEKAFSGELTAEQAETAVEEVTA